MYNLKAQKLFSGFTLIEVMISLFVLVMIGTLTAKAIVEAAKLKVSLSEETDFTSELRTSLSIIERDLNQVFNPRWFLSPDLKPLDPYAPPVPAQNTGGKTQARPPLTNEELNRKLKGTAFQVYDFWGPVLDPTGVRASRFKGDDAHLSFVTSSHVRVYQQKKESIYVKVKYEFTKDTLYKTVNTRVFELDEPKDVPYVTTYEVLKHIKKFKFSYLKKGEKEAVRSWDSEGQDIKAEKGIFPEAVEIEMEIEAPAKKTEITKVLFKLETPNDVLPKTY